MSKNEKNIYPITPDFFEKNIAKKAEEIRAAKAEYYGAKDFRNDETQNGANGVRFEFECHSSRDKRSKIGKEKNDDITVYIDLGNGFCRKERAECKTNGGRIDGIIKAVKRGEEFMVIYELALMNSTTGGKYIYIPAVYCPASKFIEILTECKAIKTVNKNGEFDGYAIQPSKRTFWRELEKLPRFRKNEFLYY